MLVGVTGTAIVAIAGFRNTRDATDKTLRAARSDRLWDRKADAYQDALTAALWRNHRRMYLTHTELTEEQYAQAAAELFESQTRQDWWTMQGRLGTFGAPEVVKAYTLSLRATEFAHRRNDDWRRARNDAGAAQRRPGISLSDLIQASAGALGALQGAMEEAMTADLALERAIRADLGLELPVGAELDKDSAGTAPDLSASSGSPPGGVIFTDLNLRALDPSSE